MTLFMWKVTVLTFGGDSNMVLFQDKNDAEFFVAQAREAGKTVVLNKWTWKIQVEEIY